ncbi:MULTISPECIES: hypothetical protein [unclassified Pseudomonas]|uniref:hypothetical protein n=1 Tax=unclassified Pseudomonas TaxID=196821 RepID=UPI000A1F210D|nr:MULTISPECIES: hypothetical protein [unclassified Pseudomonas]UDI94247.1 hypothetical protein I5961_06830 [Pseudomonas sp. IAC-BECa141]
MLKMSRKEVFRQCGRGIKYGVLLAICYWVVDFCIRWEEAAEARAIYQKKQGACSRKLAGMEQVPILGGSLLDRTKIPGFHFGSTLRSDGSCIADLLDGSFWWTGKELFPVYETLGVEPPSSWTHYHVTARLFTRGNTTAPHNMGGRHVSWPDELIVKLKNYPGLELWLTAPPPSIKNEFSVRIFVMPDWRRRDGTPRKINCIGLNSPESKASASGLSKAYLLKMNKEQLENLEFGSLRTYCTVELHHFDFAGGDARIHLGTEGLRGAPEALKAVSDYLSHSIITGK